MSGVSRFLGTLEGHNGWVTQIATNQAHPDIVLSSSRDKTIIIWELQHTPGQYGVAKHALTGHNHFVSDVVMSSDGRFALSGSWDKTLRLWNLNTGESTKRFVGHTGDVLSVAFSADNRQIVSGSRDKTAKLWNTLGDPKYTFEQDGHTDWVSCVRFSPNTETPLIVSCGWDKVVKVWNQRNCKLRTDHYGHTGYLNNVTISPDGTLCASGGKDGNAMLWDLAARKSLYTLAHSSCINALCFSPTRYWLCVATDDGIEIWNLEGQVKVETLKVDAVMSANESGKTPKHPKCLCLAWSHDGETLFAGYTDNIIRVWQFTHSTQ